MLNEKKDKMNHFLSTNKISFNACYLKMPLRCKVVIKINLIPISFKMKNLKQGDSLSERMINKTFRQKRDKNLRIIFAWGDFRIL
ncbi:hypothetical protein N197_07525 [Helicobacter pylori UM023]|nr:hypothetical protein N197_07525 [Helicobacter pylori UM023]